MLGARTGALFLREGATLRAVARAATVPVDPELGKRYYAIPLDSPIPAADTARDGHPRWMHSSADFARQYPHLEPDIRALGSEAGVSLPLWVGGEVVGSLNFSFAGTLEWDPAEQAFVLTLAGLCAQALERARLYEDLRAGEERYRLLVQNSANIVWSAEPDGRFKGRQESWERFTGQRFEEYQNFGGFEAVHPDDRGKVAQAWQEALGRRTPFEMEYRLRRGDGQYRHVLVRAVPMLGPGGEVREWVGYIEDITERKRAELDDRFLLDLEARLRPLGEPEEILAAASSALGEYLAVDRCHFARIEGERFTVLRDWSRGLPSLAGSYPIANLITPEGEAAYRRGETLKVEDAEAHPFTAALAANYRQTGVRAFVSVPQFYRGEWVAVMNLVSARPRHWHAEEVGLAQEVAGRVWPLVERAQADQALRRSLEAQRRFVADASHELRAPLTAILGNLELLTLFRDIPPEERAASLRESAQEAARLSRLVNDLLTLARGDSGVPLRLARMELGEVLRQAAGEARHLSREHRLWLEPGPPLPLVADPDRIKQLVLILLENAFKYTPEGGEVWLGWREAEGWAEFWVRDSGVGIAPHDLPRVFDRFYRADVSRSRDPGGTGLGLSIARWIVEYHGGDIRLESELGRGTAAFVRLPLTPPERPHGE